MGTPGTPIEVVATNKPIVDAELRSTLDTLAAGIKRQGAIDGWLTRDGIQAAIAWRPPKAPGWDLGAMAGTTWSGDFRVGARARFSW